MKIWYRGQKRDMKLFRSTYKRLIEQIFLASFAYFICIIFQLTIDDATNKDHASDGEYILRLPICEDEFDVIFFSLFHCFPIEKLSKFVFIGCCR